MEPLSETVLSLPDAEGVLSDWDSVLPEDRKRLVVTASLQGGPLLTTCVHHTHLTTALELWTEAACAAIQAQRPEHFLTILQRFPDVMNRKSEKGLSCYQAILATGNLETLIQCINVTTEVVGLELFKETFSGFQKIAWKQALAGNFDNIKSLSTLLPSAFNILILPKSRETLLSDFIRFSSLPSLHSLLSSDFLPMDLSTNLGITGLMTAIMHAKSDLEQRVEILLEAGCDPLWNDIWMNSAFHYVLKSMKMTAVRDK